MHPLPRRLRDRLTDAGYTYDTVVDHLGPQAHAALARNETVPAAQATTGGTALDTLIRLFLLQRPIPTAQAARVFGDDLDDLVSAGLITADTDPATATLRAGLDVRPYADDDTDLWVVSDLTPGFDGADNRVAADHVLGISPASTSLTQLTLRHRVDNALDLGTGCGVQALHLAGHAGRVVATDVNERALWVTRFNAELNDIDRIDVRAGSLFEPVAGERFDLITTNPPFVISPGDGDLLVYRDSGLPGDQVVERIVRGASGHLTDGGWCQILANWIVADGTPWDERLAAWVPAELDAFVVQREILDPAAYVELWLKDSGHHGAVDYHDRYDAWLTWLQQQGVAGIGFGWINLQRAGSSHPARELIDWPYDVEQPIAPGIAAWATAVAADAGYDDPSLLAARLRAAPDLIQETQGQPGAADPATIVVRQQRGLRRATQVDTATAAVIGACDGDLTLQQILDAVGSILDDPGLPSRSLPRVRELLREGFLLPEQARH